MANGKDKLQKVIDDLKKQVDVVSKDVETLVTAAVQNYNELKGTITPADVTDIIVEVVLPKLPLPWYVPTFVAKAVIGAWVTKVLAKKA